MDELEKRREDIEFNIYQEKKEKKILLICCAICSGLGFVSGVVYGIYTRSMYDFLMGIIAWGIWAGPGFGSAISLIPIYISIYKNSKKRGETDIGVITNVIFFLVFFFAGPIGLLIRVLRKNSLIKKYERQLKALR